MKRIGALALTFVLSFLAHPAARADSWRGSVIWKVEKPGIPPSYIMGTMHTGDARVLALLEPARKLICRSRMLYGELDMQQGLSGINIDTLLSETLPKGNNWTTYLSAEEKRTLAKALAGQIPVDGMTESLMQNPDTVLQLVSGMQPWLIALMLQAPPGDPSEVLDMQLQQAAQHCGVAVRALETVEEQTGIFSSLPLNDQIALLRETLRELPDAASQMQAITRDYLRGDLDALEKEEKRQSSSTDNSRLKNLDEELLTKRNQRMFTRMIGNAAVGNVFVAVGALHLAGDTGLLTRFRQAGWKVTPVPLRP